MRGWLIFMNCFIFSPEAETGVDSRGTQSASTTEGTGQGRATKNRREGRRRKKDRDTDKNAFKVGKSEGLAHI